MTKTRRIRTSFRTRANHQLLTLDWHILRSLGNSKIVKTSYFWFFFVPATARLMLPVAGKHEVAIPWLNSGAPFQINLDLPFNWKVFCVMSIMFMAGQFVYAIACPQVVKLYKSYGEYRLHHVGPSRLSGFILEAASRIKAESLNKLAYDLIKLTPEGVERHLADGGLKRLSEVMSTQLLAAEEPDWSAAFDHILDLEATTRRPAFFASLAFFAIGMILLLWVMGENCVAFIKLASVS